MCSSIPADSYVINMMIVHTVQVSFSTFGTREMTVLTFTLILFAGAYSAGLVGSLTGLGGGVVIIPLLTVVLGVDIHYAIGAALVSVIATSSGSAAAYVREGITNIRLGMFLEIATTAGAVCGAMLASVAPAHLIAILFGSTLIFSALNSMRKKAEHQVPVSSRLAVKLKLPGSYPSTSGPISYGTKNVIGGFSMMGLAGMLSGLLGIGSGAFKVIAMDNIMKIPFKVSTTTSNFMMGVTATASAVIYLQKGYIEPGICMPVVIGVLLGAMTGAQILIRANPKKLRIFFAVVIISLGLNMIYNGVVGNF
ncbi:hypothetical protein SAMN05216436_105169 [bacterium A37T11]|nr:hypothetical protein SAMN05216436_105169 [bacterium A37T11]